jgi:hypothetical protein
MLKKVINVQQLLLAQAGRVRHDFYDDVAFRPGRDPLQPRLSSGATRKAKKRRKEKT